MNINVKKIHKPIFYDSVVSIFKKQELSGTISTTNQSKKLVAVYDIRTLELVSAFLSIGNEDYKLYLPSIPDKNIMAVCRDLGGNFNADIYDRLSLCTEEYPQFEGYVALEFKHYIFHKKIYPIINVKKLAHGSSLIFEDISNDVKGCIISDRLGFVDSLNLPVNTNFLDGLLINGKNPIFNGSLLGKVRNEENGSIVHDIFGDSSAEVTFPFSGETTDLSGNYRLGSPLYSEYKGMTYLHRTKQSVLSNPVSSNFGFRANQQYSISFILIDYGSSYSSSYGVFMNYGGLVIDVAYTGTSISIKAQIPNGSWVVAAFTYSLYKKLTHFVFTFGDGTAKLYADKEYRGSVSFSGITQTFTTKQVDFGGTMGNIFPFLMRMFRVFNKIVNQTEVDTLYDEIVNFVNNIGVKSITGLKKDSKENITFSKNTKPVIMDLMCDGGVYDASGNYQVENFDLIHTKDGYESNGLTTIFKAPTVGDVSGNYGLGIANFDLQCRFKIKEKSPEVSKSRYPPAFSDVYVKATTSYSGYYPYWATNPDLSLLGTWSGTSWVSASNIVTNQKFNMDCGVPIVLSEIYLENGHIQGTSTETGIKDFSVYGTNVESAFLNTVYENLDDLTLLGTFQAQKHTASDTSSPQYFKVIGNTIPFRYYVHRIANCWGSVAYMVIRHISLRTKINFINTVIWKAGNLENGVAIGHKDGQLGIFGNKNSVQNAITVNLDLIEEDAWYNLIYKNQEIFIIDQNSNIIYAANAFEFSSGTAQESIGCSVDGSPFEEYTEPINNLYGTVKDIRFFENGTVGINVKDINKFFAEVGGTGEQCFIKASQFNLESEEINIWVIVPHLSSTVDNSIRLYFGNKELDNLKYLDVVAESPENPVGASQDWLDLRALSELDDLCTYSVDYETPKKVIEFTIQSNLIEDDLVNFPVNLHFGESVGVNKVFTHDVLLTDWNKLHITDKDGNYLTTEVETWEKGMSDYDYFMIVIDPIDATTVNALYSNGYPSWKALDTFTTLTGSGINNSWLSLVYLDPIRFNIKNTSNYPISKIGVYNGHDGDVGSELYGIKNFSVYGSNNTNDFPPTDPLLLDGMVHLGDFEASRGSYIEPFEEFFKFTDLFTKYTYLSIVISSNHGGGYCGVRRFTLYSGGKIFEDWKFDPNNIGLIITLVNDRYTAYQHLSGYHSAISDNTGSTGRVYKEIVVGPTCDGNSIIGLSHVGCFTGTYPGGQTVKPSIGFSRSGGLHVNGITANVGNVGVHSENSTIMFAIDQSSGFVWIGVNGVWLSDPSYGVDPTFSGFNTELNGEIVLMVSPYVANPGNSYTIINDPLLQTYDSPFAYDSFGYLFPGRGSLHVKVPLIKKYENFPIYIDYTDTNEVNPNIGETGSEQAQSVWENYIFVYHMNQDPNVTNVLNSATNYFHLVKDASGVYADNNGVNFSGGSLKAENLNIQLNDITFEFEIFNSIAQGPTEGELFTAQNGYWAIKSNPSYKTIKIGTVTCPCNFSYLGKQLIALVGNMETSTLARLGFVVDGFSDGFTYPVNVGSSSLNSMYLCKSIANIPFRGLVAGVRLSNVKRSNAWLKATRLSLLDGMCVIKDVQVPKLNSPLVQYGYGVNITIPYTLIPSDMYDFPLLIKINNMSGLNTFDFQDWTKEFLKNTEYRGNILRKYDFAKYGLNGFHSGNVVYGYGPGSSPKSATNFERLQERTFKITKPPRIEFTRSFSLYFDFFFDFNFPINTYFGIFGTNTQGEIFAYIYNGDLYIQLYGVGFSSPSGVSIEVGWNRVCVSYNMTTRVLSYVVNRIDNYVEIVVATPVNSVSTSDFIIGKYTGQNTYPDCVGRILMLEGASSREEMLELITQGSSNSVEIKDFYTVLINDGEIYKPYKGDPLTSVSVEVHNQGIASFSFTFDDESYLIHQNNSWVTIATKNDSIHGNTGNNEWFYKDKHGDWNHSGISAATCITKAVKEGYLMLSVDHLQQSDFDSVYSMVTGIVNSAITMQAHSETNPIHVSKIWFNGVQNWISEEYDLKNLAEEVNSSVIDWYIENGQPEDYEKIKVFVMLSNSPRWLQCTREGQIPYLTQGLDTTGLKMKFKITSESFDVKPCVLDIKIKPYLPISVTFGV